MSSWGRSPKDLRGRFLALRARNDIFGQPGLRSCIHGHGTSFIWKRVHFTTKTKRSLIAHFFQSSIFIGHCNPSLYNQAFRRNPQCFFTRNCQTEISISTRMWSVIILLEQPSITVAIFIFFKTVAQAEQAWFEARVLPQICVSDWNEWGTYFELRGSRTFMPNSLILTP